MKDEIKAIIEKHLYAAELAPRMTTDQRVDAAAEAIAALPVDRVQAMALFVKDKGGGRYAVPDTEMKMHAVDITRQGAFCHLTKNFTLCSRGNCEHAKAVELYLARQ